MRRRERDRLDQRTPVSRSWPTERKVAELTARAEVASTAPDRPELPAAERLLDIGDAILREPLR